MSARDAGWVIRVSTGDGAYIGTTQARALADVPAWAADLIETITDQAVSSSDVKAAIS